MPFPSSGHTQEMPGIAMHPLHLTRTLRLSSALRSCLYTKGWRQLPHTVQQQQQQQREQQLKRQCTASSSATSSSNGASSSEQPHFYLTTPLYYVNAEPHMGSAYTTLAGDAITRFQRMRGCRTTFVTGTDEHGEKIAEAAARKRQAPQEHCDAVVAAFKALWDEMDIRYDAFIRTTDAKHEGVVHAVLDRVWEAGDIYKAKYEGWYCVGCEAYKDDAEMEGDRVCPLHKRRCVERSEENYFFALSKYQARIQALIEGDGGFVQPAARRNEVLAWVRAGLRDFSISRAAVAWGIPIPRDPAQTVYVWFDALLGYMSALLPEGTPPDGAELAARGWPADVHLVGKDILRFHAVYWPGMLLSAGLPLPKRVFAHGFLTKDGQKMGKSLGNVLEPRALLAAYGPDAVRFYFLKEVVFGQDGDFSEQRFRDIVNAYLANSVGNLLNRALGLLRKNCGGALPAGADSISAGHPLRSVADAQVGAAADAYEELRMHDALEAALAIANRGNLYMEEVTPWTAFKKGSEEQKRDAGLALVAVLEAVRIVAVLLAPVTPALSGRMYAALGYSTEQYGRVMWADAAWGGLRQGQSTPPPVPVFQRIEGDLVIGTAPVRAAAVAA